MIKRINKEHEIKGDKSTLNVKRGNTDNGRIPQKKKKNILAPRSD